MTTIHRGPRPTYRDGWGRTTAGTVHRITEAA